MVNICSVFHCNSNKPGYPKKTAFRIPKNEEKREYWLKFLNRKDLNLNMDFIYICELHFEEQFLSRNENRVRLINAHNALPTIFPKEIEKKSLLPNLPSTRAPLQVRVFRPDEIHSNAYKQLSVKSLSDINEHKVSKILGKDYEFRKTSEHVVFYKMETSEIGIPKITECIKIDHEMHVALFCNNCPVPLPQWFRHGNTCKLVSLTQLENFPVYLKAKREEFSSKFAEELEMIRYQKNPRYSNNVLRYSLMMRYTSLPAYSLMQKEYNLPSLSHISKLKSSGIDAVKALVSLKANGNMSGDVVLLFDEMYLQQCQQYTGGNLEGCYASGSMYNGIVSFMLVGLKSNVPFVVRAVPKIKLSGVWLRDEIVKTVDVVIEAGFYVKGIVCDNHAANVSAFRILKEECPIDDQKLSIYYKEQRIYLFYDTVHLIKNIRNNLLERKRFIFPNFKFVGFSKDITVTSGEVSWRLLHEVHDADSSCSSNLRKANKLNAQALHPGACKQSVPPAVAVFHETTSAALLSYFPQCQSAAEFLQLVNTWWTLSNAKQKYNRNNDIGNAAVLNDQKPEFLRSFADWLVQWRDLKIPNAEKFHLSKQTSDALIQTLRCHASLIEDLLSSGSYDFVLTAKLQSDPIERRFSQYRQMSGGRFLVSLKDVNCSEKILKIKSLLKSNCDLKDAESSLLPDEKKSALKDIDEKISVTDVDSFALNEQTKEVSNFVAGYVAKKVKVLTETCCSQLLTGYCPDDGYIKLMSRGGLIVPSSALSDTVATSFSILDHFSSDIQRCSLNSREAAEYILRQCLLVEEISCEDHSDVVYRKLIRIVTNVFFNNHCKRKAEELLQDKVKLFKKLKREKRT